MLYQIFCVKEGDFSETEGNAGCSRWSSSYLVVSEMYKMYLLREVAVEIFLLHDGVENINNKSLIFGFNIYERNVFGMSMDNFRLLLDFFLNMRQNC